MDKLVEVGMLTREQSKVDRREVVICVSERAETLMQRLESLFLGYILDIMTRIGPERSQQWLDIYQVIGAALDERAHEPGPAPDAAAS